MIRFCIALFSLFAITSPAGADEPTKLYQDFWTGQSRAELAQQYPLDEHGHLTFTASFEEGYHGALLFDGDRLTAVSFNFHPVLFNAMDLSGKFLDSRFRPLTMRSKGISIDVVDYLAKGGKAEDLTEMMLTGMADHDLAIIYAELETLYPGTNAAASLAQLSPETRMLLFTAQPAKITAVITSRANFQKARL